MWREGNRIHFKTTVSETNDTVLSGNVIICSHIYDIYLCLFYTLTYNVFMSSHLDYIYLALTVTFNNLKQICTHKIVCIVVYL